MDKKLVGEYFFKKRFIWLDNTAKSFHWSKSEDKKVPHKRIKLVDQVTNVVENPKSSSFFSNDPERGFTITFHNGDVIIIRVIICVECFFFLILN